MVKDAIRLFGEGHTFNIPVTDALRHSARAAHQKYKEAQEKKQQEELEMTRKKIIEQNQREQEVAEEKERAHENSPFTLTLCFRSVRKLLIHSTILLSIL